VPNPNDRLKKDDPDKRESKTVQEIIPEIETDQFSPKEQKDLLKIIQSDVDYGEDVQKDYIENKRTALKHYHMEKPSTIENLTKRAWQSDRNLGLARAVADSYQAVLLSTCWNPDSLHFVATTSSDIDNRNNQAAFTKWGMGKHESNAQPEMDAFVHNRVVLGFSMFKIYRKTTSEWIDRRIPVKNKEGKTYKYNIKTEKITIQKGIIENIPDIDDILMPAYGKNIQELPFFIHRLRLDGEVVLDLLDRKILKPDDVEAYKKKLYNHAYEEKKRSLSEEKMKTLGINSAADFSDLDIRRLDITLYEWYGMVTKGRKTEKYRIIVDLTNQEFLSGKPLRKINRSGKIPFSGGSLVKEPGQIRGESLMNIIAPVVNAFNNVFNQKSDFQYVTNCPFGFYNPDEGYTKQTFELEPMVAYPVNGKPQDNVYFPNLQRSMAWAESDIRILLEILERLTGAASYFSVGQQRNKTLGQDMLVDKQSETRFGLWVSRILNDISQAIGMWYELYQDYPPKGLAERVIGKDGKKLFPNISVETLRGDPDVQMTPDSVSGSKAYKRQLQLWGFQAAQSMMWLNPQVNPGGNWELCSDTLKEVMQVSDSDVKRYIGEKPPAPFNEETLEQEWRQFMNGEDFDPPEGETQMAMQHLVGHMKQKEEKYHELDEEYRPNFDAHLFKTGINVMKFMQNVQKEQMANRIAAGAIMSGQMAPGQQGQPPTAAEPGVAAPGAIPGQPAEQGQPGGMMGQEGGMNV
jgi:hypothetical protein